MLVGLKLNEMIMIWMGLCSEWQTAALFASPCIISQWSYGEKLFVLGTQPSRGNCGEKRWDFSCFACPQSLLTQRLLCATLAPTGKGVADSIMELKPASFPVSFSSYISQSCSSRAKQYRSLDSRAWPFRMLSRAAGWAACPCMAGGP